MSASKFVKSTSTGLFAFAFLFLAATFASAQFSAKNLHGDWVGEIEMTKEKMAELTGGQAAGLEMSMDINLGVTFNADGTYTSVNKLGMNLAMMGQDMALSFQIDDVGTWKLEGDILTQTSNGSTVTPLDAMSKNIVQASPEMLGNMTTKAGQETSVTILGLTGSKYSYKIPELADIEVSMTRK